MLNTINDVHLSTYYCGLPFGVTNSIYFTPVTELDSMHINEHNITCMGDNS